MNLINCTPHAISIRRADGSTIVIAASGQLARVAMSETPAAPFEGVAVISRVNGTVEGLPRDAAGRVVPCLVSGMVLDALRVCYPHTAGSHPLSGIVFAPDSGATAIRENGQVVAVTRLVTL